MILSRIDKKQTYQAWHALWPTTIFRHRVTWFESV